MKGYVHTLEAVITATIILIVLFNITTPYMYSGPKVREIGYNCLKSLDISGSLKYYAVNGLEDELTGDLKKCLPPLLKFNVKICDDPECTTAIQNTTVVSANYIISGYEKYNPKVIELWMWSE